MNDKVSIREISGEEREFLSNLMKSDPLYQGSDVRCFLSNFIVLMACYSAVLLLFCGVGYLGWYAVYGEFPSDVSDEVTRSLTVIGVVVLFQAIGSALKNVKQNRAWCLQYTESVSTGMVKEEHFNVLSAKRATFVDCKDVIYFLQVDDGRVFALYDAMVNSTIESLSYYTVKSHVNMVITVNNERLLSFEFSGQPLGIEHTFVLVESADNWPDEGFIDIPWAEVENRFSA